ncbi:hypothetical protein BDP27DRAFT_1453539 [Rhodocollybia butyracea]|uniref:G domain-containing protein n=1 Tax=Rhodocollybia butyracea TaxID=206335 RepID=A0A9P5P8T2_9AGAR|nr:hypothetical protein BDP27DRAFT_1453539 [Rhodocollybia butyracea]
MSQLDLEPPPYSVGPQSPQTPDSVLVAFEKFSNVAKTVKEFCPRIRILVMGRRNAGKTTLLKKMTNSSDGRVILRNQDGSIVRDPGMILEPSVERGGSHIEYEITYPSDLDYVFHDSKGMEAGSEMELHILREFIDARQKKQFMKDQLHVIWLCLPMDNDRPLGPQEMAFFENAGTHGVPVIAIFTKFEWRETKAYDILRDSGKEHGEAKQRALQLARDEFEETVVQQRFHDGLSHKPIEYIYLQNMNKGGNCDQLTEVTAWVVQNAVNQKLFGEIKQRDVMVSMAIALTNAISMTKLKAQLAVGQKPVIKKWTIFLLSFFAYWDGKFLIYRKPSKYLVLIRYIETRKHAYPVISPVESRPGDSFLL